MKKGNSHVSSCPDSPSPTESMNKPSRAHGCPGALPAGSGPAGVSKVHRAEKLPVLGHLQGSSRDGWAQGQEGTVALLRVNNGQDAPERTEGTWEKGDSQRQAEPLRVEELVGGLEQPGKWMRPQRPVSAELSASHRPVQADVGLRHSSQKHIRRPAWSAGKLARAPSCGSKESQPAVHGSTCVSKNCAPFSARPGTCRTGD